jgi:hypothetical protein
MSEDEKQREAHQPPRLKGYPPLKKAVLTPVTNTSKTHALRLYIGNGAEILIPAGETMDVWL